MSKGRAIILVAMLLLVAADIAIVFFGAFVGHQGVTNFGIDMGKVIFGAVIGALSAAFTEK